MRALLTALLVAASATAGAQVDSPHARVSLVADKSAIRLGDSFYVALRFEMDPSWHIYWKNPGDSGYPLSAEWTLSPGATAGKALWPLPKRIRVGPLANYGYEHLVYLPFEMSTQGMNPQSRFVDIRVSADWLICKVACLPASGRFSLRVPIEVASKGEPTHAEPIQEFLATVPGLTHLVAASFSVDAKSFVISVDLDEALRDVKSAEFFPTTDFSVVAAAKQDFERTPEGFRLSLTRDPNSNAKLASLEGVLSMQAATDSFAFEITASPASFKMNWAEQLKIFALALLGGLLLNLMPCVFPVLSLKILGFVEQAGHDPSKIRRHGWAFAGGVLVSFWLLAGVLLGLRALGHSLGWGFQLQSPLFVALMALLFYAIGMNLLGLFEFGSRLQNIGATARARGLRASFLDGALATLVATPCTAPFMGVALGAALSQPSALALLTFTFLGLGMLSPYLALSYAPQLLARLPRPGVWMERFKEFLSFPLFATAIWLLWVLGQQAGVDAVVALLFSFLLFSLGLWARRGTGGASKLRQVAILALILFSIAVATLGVQGRIAAPNTTTSVSTWEPYTPALFGAARERGDAILIDFTASWCITCQVNKRTVLNQSEFTEEAKRRGIRLLRADWTQRDSAISAHLSGLNRSSVPTYAFYPAGKESVPVLLPEILTLQGTLEALAKP
jgi:thiol:disulfide interchange protein